VVKKLISPGVVFFYLNGLFENPGECLNALVRCGVVVVVVDAVDAVADAVVVGLPYLADDDLVANEPLKKMMN